MASIKLSNEYEIRYSPSGKCSWNEKPVSNLCRFMNSDTSLREDFLTKYESFLNKYDIKEKGLGNIFIPNIETEVYVKHITQGISKPVGTFISEILSNSYRMRDIINKLVKNEVLAKYNHPIVICNKCNRVSFGKKMCSHDNCGETKELTYFETYIFSDELLSIWKKGRVFLEGMCYWALKDKGFKPMIGAEVYKIKRRNQETDIDNFLKFGNEKVAILCTTSPSGGNEKNQAKLCNKLKLHTIVVTTSNTGGTMEQYGDKVFPTIKTDAEFPGNLVTYISELK